MGQVDKVIFASLPIIAAAGSKASRNAWCVATKSTPVVNTILPRQASWAPELVNALVSRRGRLVSEAFVSAIGSAHRVGATVTMPLSQVSKDRVDLEQAVMQARRLDVKDDFVQVTLSDWAHGRGTHVDTSNRVNPGRMLAELESSIPSGPGSASS